MRPLAKGLIATLLIGTVLIGTFLALSGGFLTIEVPPIDEPTIPEEPEVPLEPPVGLSYEGVDIVWLVVEGVKLKYNDIVIYIDPFDIYNKNETVLEIADYVIITHNHLPHCSPRDYRSVSDSNTTLIASRGASFTPGVFEDEVVIPGDKLTYGEIMFEFYPSYNIDKYRPEGPLYHEPGPNNIGVVIDFNGTRVYHAGDT
ncbi:MAG: MBL fold metallo-hydrolase, partial [Candidatus Thorarchaeota archaeon]